MQIYYLEIVTREADAARAAYAAANGVQSGKPDSGLGNARTAEMSGGGRVRVRAPLRDTGGPVVRPHRPVDDIEAAVAAVAEAGGETAVPPTDIPGRGTFAVYLTGRHRPRLPAAVDACRHTSPDGLTNPATDERTRRSGRTRGPGLARSQPNRAFGA